MACNERLRGMVRAMTESRGGSAFAPPRSLCVENGAMIAWTGELALRSGVTVPVEQLPGRAASTDGPCRHPLARERGPAMTDCGCAIVGAGPAGSTAAYHLARAGHSVLVVEEHPNVGFPVQCAGLVSQRVLERAQAPTIVRRPVHGASVFSPSLGARSHSEATEPRAFVIDRAGLDIALADRAARAGADIAVGTKFDRLGSGNGRTNVELVDDDQGRCSIEARLVIGADGVTSAVARAFRLRRPSNSFPRSKPSSPRARGTPTRSRSTWVRTSHRISSDGGFPMAREGLVSASR